MPQFNNYSVSSVNNLVNRLKDNLKGFSYLDEAAQKAMDVLKDEFQDSLVLARVYATVPYAVLPDFNKKFVNKLAEDKGIKTLVNDKTLVLSLLGTRGTEPDWNDRKKSRGHVGIPLVSASFVEEIPMVARLMKEMGLELDWIDKNDTNIVVKKIGNMAGVFYVPDALTQVDNRNRKIIADQNFAAKYNVKSVFGIGGCYMDGTFITVILFTNEALQKSQAEAFTSLINSIKSSTLELVSSKKFLKS